MHYKAYNSKTLREIPQLGRMTDRQIRDIEVVSTVFPFKVNNYVLDNLIEWEDFQNDPIFRLTFPQRDMLQPDQFEAVEAALPHPEKLAKTVGRLRTSLNPNPAGQMQLNVPTIGGHLLDGSIVRGVIECFITEILGIDVLYPEGKMIDPHAEEFPENWYQEIK